MTAVRTSTTMYQTARLPPPGAMLKWSLIATKWLVPIMKNMTGMENSVFVREASAARRAAGAAAGSAS